MLFYTIILGGKILSFKSNFLCLVLFFLIFSQLVLAQNSFNYSISPGTNYFDYNAGQTVEGHFTIFSKSEDVNQLMKLTIIPDTKQSGYTGRFYDIAKHTKLETDRFVLKSGEKFDVKYFIFMSKSLLPGKHFVRINVSPVIKSGKGVGTLVKLGFQAIVVNPYSGKHGEIKSIRVGDKIGGGNVKFTIDFWNLGSEIINTAKARIEIFDEHNRKIETIFSEPEQKPIQSDEVRVIHAFFNGSQYRSGSYKAKVSVNYDGIETLQSQMLFRLGVPLIRIRDLLNIYFFSGEINRVSLDIESAWNKPINEAFVEVELFSHDQNAVLVNSRSTDFSLKSYERKNVNVFIDLSDVKPGNYQFKATSHFPDGTSVFEKELTVLPAGLGMFIVLVPLTLFIIIVFFLNKNKHKLKLFVTKVKQKTISSQKIRQTPVQISSNMPQTTVKSIIPFTDVVSLKEVEIAIKKTVKLTASFTLIKSFLLEQEKDFKNLNESQDKYKKLYDSNNHILSIDSALLMLVEQKSLLEKIRLFILENNFSQKQNQKEQLKKIEKKHDIEKKQNQLKEQINETNNFVVEPKVLTVEKNKLLSKNVSNEKQFEFKPTSLSRFSTNSPLIPQTNSEKVLDRINRARKIFNSGLISKESFDLISSNLEKELIEAKKIDKSCKILFQTKKANFKPTNVTSEKVYPDEKPTIQDFEDKVKEDIIGSENKKNLKI